ncbi:MAG: NADH-quinone oxidoreductase subunit J [Armatimonadaceae bacterium]|jgi:NADH-quinone oxidoreductase subunit J
MPLQWLLDGQNLALLVFAVVAVATALLTVISSNPLRSALFLVLNLFCVAGIYLTLSAFFLSAVQVIVYAGAIMVLFLFVIMLLNLSSPDTTRNPLRYQTAIAFLTAGGIATFLILVFGRSLKGLGDGSESGFVGSVSAIGKDLYSPSRPWLFPFELTSVLLLVAVIGAVVLARRTGEAGS